MIVFGEGLSIFLSRMTLGVINPTPGWASCSGVVGQHKAHSTFSSGFFLVVGEKEQEVGRIWGELGEWKGKTIKIYCMKSSKNR